MPVDTTSPPAKSLRRRVQALEHEVVHARREAEAARAEAAVAKKAAVDAWALVKQLRGVPYRG